jgi:hypothetical protein
MSDKDIIDAHKYSSKNKANILKDDICGCFYCLKIFSPNEIEKWINDEEDGTAVCPYCGIDSVIGKSSGFPIIKDFLLKMNKHWF